MSSAMERKKLAPLKGSWLYIWVSNNECNKKSTDEEEGNPDIDKAKDQKDEDTISIISSSKNKISGQNQKGDDTTSITSSSKRKNAEQKDQRNEDTTSIMSSSRRKISVQRLNTREDLPESQKKSNDVLIDMNDESIDKNTKFSVQRLNTQEGDKGQIDGDAKEDEEAVTRTPQMSKHDSWCKPTLDEKPINSYEQIIHDIDEIIETLCINIVIKQIIDDKTLIQMFIPDNKIEEVLNEVNYVKQIGFKPGTAVSLLPTTLNYHSYQKIPPKCLDRSDTGGRDSVKEKMDTYREKKKKQMTQFYKTLKSRVVVAEVIDKIEAGAEFTFDYIVLVMIAAMLAFLGLIEDSPVILVASMLVSPIMGPILAGIFGFNIRHYKLVKIGIKRETYSLLICIALGFFFGLIIDNFVNEYKGWTNTQDQDELEWPTDQMSSRVQSRGLVTGILIALPSGVGVALSVLGGNAGSLVGVAISASLLPPAVNAGLFWAMSLHEVMNPSCPRFIDSHNVNDSSGCTNRTYIWKNQIHDMFSVDEIGHTGERLALEYFVRGWVSLLLTLLNIICIIIMGIFCLWIKEVTPQKIPQRNAQLWSDVHYNNTVKKRFRSRKKSTNKKTDLTELFQQLDIPEERQGEFIHDAIEDLANDENLVNIQNLFSANPVKSRRSEVFSHNLEDTFIGSLFNEEGSSPWTERKDSKKVQKGSGMIGSRRNSEVPYIKFDVEVERIPSKRRRGTTAGTRFSMVQTRELHKIEKEIRAGRNPHKTDATGLTLT